MGAIEWMTRTPKPSRWCWSASTRPIWCGRAALGYLEFIRDGLPLHLRACDQADFSLWRTDDRRACGVFGITQRQFDRDFVTREFAMAKPEVTPDGKPLL